MPNDSDLFSDALALPMAEREGFLHRMCGDDSAQRERILGLLRAHERAQVTLAVPLTHRQPIVEADAGSWVGRYKLLEKIGEGGCGVVWMAQQEEPVRRRVALKVIKLGMDTKEVIARFEAERQALALMEHPNIAKVLEAGATATGRPYFVMELVRGQPITVYCDERRLDTNRRLALFSQVCRAIQHAHDKGIVHRDIKPSNILVTQEDGEPLPKVIDFGIAKATQGRLTDRTLFTAFEQFIGTPAYMSPEQADFNAHDVDGRSDVYSLGALLYELIAGRPPFDPKALLSQGIDEVRRVIREVEPPQPSTQLDSLTVAERTALAQSRGLAPAQHATLIRGDLDWIAMKALDKNRFRRYGSATALAEDIDRFLANEPVLARPPSPIYLVQKFVLRHRVVVAAIAAIVLALELGLAASMWQAHRASRAEAEQARLREAHANALAAAARAADEAEMAHARDLLGQLQENFWGEILPEYREDKIGLRVARALATLEHMPVAERTEQWGRDRALLDLRGALADRRQITRDYTRRAELVRAELVRRQGAGDTSEEARLLLAIAEVVRFDPVAPVNLFGNDRNARARQDALQRAEDLLRPIATEPGSSARYRLHFVELLCVQGQRQWGPKSEEYLRSALAVLESVAPAARATPSGQLQRARVLALLGSRLPDAECGRLQEEALEVADAVLKQRPDSLAVLRLKVEVARDRARRSRLRIAELEHLDAEFRFGSELYRRDPSNDDDWYACLNAGRQRGYVLLDHGRISDALSSFHAVVEEGNYPVRLGVVPALKGKRYLPGVFERIAYWEAARGNRPLAEQALLAVYRHTPGLDVGPGGTDLAVMLRDPIYVWRLARTGLLFAGDFAGTIANGEANWSQLKILLLRPGATEADRISFQKEVESVQEHLAEAHIHLGNFAAAEAVLATPPGLKPAKAARFTPVMQIWLALAQARQGRGAEARKTLAPVLQNFRKKPPTALEEREILARAFYVDAVVQPATEEGRKRRQAALDESRQVLAGLTDEARQLRNQRILMDWLAQESARAP